MLTEKCVVSEILFLIGCKMAYKMYARTDTGRKNVDARQKVIISKCIYLVFIVDGRTLALHTVSYDHSIVPFLLHFDRHKRAVRIIISAYFEHEVKR